MPKLSVNVNCNDLRRVAKQLQQLADNNEVIMQQITKEIAARLLRTTKKRTPRGESKKGHVGGTLMRGWKVGELQKNGDTYTIEIYNNVEYAPYVEYGHRTRDHKKWVRGTYMLTISEQELKGKVEAIVERKIKKLLEGALK